MGRNILIAGKECKKLKLDLTPGNQYKILTEHNGNVSVINDKGNLHIYDKKLFSIPKNEKETRGGQYVKKLRTLSKIGTQADMANEFKVERSYISQLENGQKSFSLSRFITWCEHLNVDPKKMFSEKDWL